VPLEKVRILPASTAYSPDEGVTSGSLSIQGGGKALAQDVRRAARAAQAQRPALTTGSSRWRATYSGGGAGEAAAEYRIVGKSVPRLELPRRSRKPSYVHDNRAARGALVHGAHPEAASPVRAQLVSHPGSAYPGRKSVRDGNFAAVLAAARGRRDRGGEEAVREGV